MKYLVTGSEGPGFTSPEQAVEVLESGEIAQELIHLFVGGRLQNKYQGTVTDRKSSETTPTHSAKAAGTTEQPIECQTQHQLHR